MSPKEPAIYRAFSAVVAAWSYGKADVMMYMAIRRIKAIQAFLYAYDVHCTIDCETKYSYCLGVSKFYSKSLSYDATSKLRFEKLFLPKHLKEPSTNK